MLDLKEWRYTTFLWTNPLGGINIPTNSNRYVLRICLFVLKIILPTATVFCSTSIPTIWSYIKKLMFCALHNWSSMPKAPGTLILILYQKIHCVKKPFHVFYILILVWRGWIKRAHLQLNVQTYWTEVITWTVSNMIKCSVECQTYCRLFLHDLYQYAPLEFIVHLSVPWQSGLMEKFEKRNHCGGIKILLDRALNMIKAKNYCTSMEDYGRLCCEWQKPKELFYWCGNNF